MRYRAIRCQDCGKVKALSLSSPEKCICGGINNYGWQIEEKGYTCFRVEKTVKSLFEGK